MHKNFLVALLIPALSIGAASNPFQKKIPKDSEAIHTLTRLTYGPRPGDVAEVRMKPFVALFMIKQLPQPARIEGVILGQIFPAVAHTWGFSQSKNLIVELLGESGLLR